MDRRMMLMPIFYNFPLGKSVCLVYGKSEYPGFYLYCCVKIKLSSEPL